MNGLIIVNKEKDCTSRDVVNEVGHIFNTKKVGHSGTLDPHATGVLVIAINDGLKIINLINSDDKEYIVEVKVGILTDSLDITGKVIKENDKLVDEKEIIEVLNSFKGNYLQEVPKYSAVKVGGKRLYEYARENIEVDLPKRMVDIKEIELLEFNKDSFKFRTLVSKGTYIRSLVRDIGDKLNICLTMNNLKRTKQGRFYIEDSYTLDDIKKNNYKLISLKDALSIYYQVEVDEFLYKRIKNGTILRNLYNKDVIVFTKDKDVIAIYKVYEKDKTKIKPIHVLL